MDAYGADTARVFALFKAPVDTVLDWDAQAIKGPARWLQRLWTYAIWLHGRARSNAANQLCVSICRCVRRLVHEAAAANDNSAPHPHDRALHEQTLAMIAKASFRSTPAGMIGRPAYTIRFGFAVLGCLGDRRHGGDVFVQHCRGGAHEAEQRAGGRIQGRTNHVDRYGQMLWSTFSKARIELARKTALLAGRGAQCIRRV